MNTKKGAGQLGIPTAIPETDRSSPTREIELRVPNFFVFSRSHYFKTGVFGVRRKFCIGKSLLGIPVGTSN